MEDVTLKFLCVRQMIEFRASTIGSYEMSTTRKILTANLSEEQLNLAGTLSATITKSIEHLQC